MGNSNAIPNSSPNADLMTYEQLMRMGFDDSLSWKAVQKEGHEINGCIKYIQKHKALQPNKVQKINDNDQNTKELFQEIQQLRAENSDLLQKVNGLEEDKDSILGQLDMIQMYNSGDQEEMIKELNQKINEYQQEMQAQHELNEQLNQQINQYKHELDAIKILEMQYNDLLKENESLKTDIAELRETNKRLTEQEKVVNGMENMQLIPAADGGGDDEEVIIENMSKETLITKYKILRLQNLATQKKIMQLVSPCEDKSDFPVIEDIRSEFDTLRKQYFTDIFDEITTEIAEQYEDDWEEEEDDDSDDEDGDEEDLFDAVVDREARRVLFDLLHITYHYIRMYKHSKFNDVIDAVALKFEVTSSKKKTKMNRSMGMVLNPYFQSYYQIFSRNRFIRDDGKNNKNGELLSGDMNKIIDEIFIFIQKQYNHYKFWNNKSISKQFEIFIAKTCELCWIMVLNTPQLYFYPRIFSINDADIAKKRYDENVSYIYNQSLLLPSHEIDGDPEVKRKRNKKKNSVKQQENEEEMDKIVKKHEFNPFKCQLFDDKYHDCLNEADDDDEDNDDHLYNDKNRNIINYNGLSIAYYGWPSMIRIPQLKTEQHTQITKTFTYIHHQPQQFMTKMFV